MDTKEGIRAGSEAVPVVSQAVFAFGHDSELSPRGESDHRHVPRHGSSPVSGYGSPTDGRDPESRKRRRQEGADDEFSLKPPPGYGGGGGPSYY